MANISPEKNTIETPIGNLEYDHLVIATGSKTNFFGSKNIDAKLLLKDIAKEAHFSPFHFHRLFSVVIGETVNNFITRKRIEKAAASFLHKRTFRLLRFLKK